MSSKTRNGERSRLAQTLPGHQFAEHHCGIVDAPAEAVWDALLRLRWTDIGPLRHFLRLRGFSRPVLQDRVFETFTRRAGAVARWESPQLALIVMVGKPWSVVPRHVPVESLPQVAAFAAPGWLKYGMEWMLHPLDGERTLVETRTLCEATDASARRLFRIYWTVVRPGSGALRIAMLAALRRLSAPSAAEPAPEPGSMVNDLLRN